MQIEPIGLVALALGLLGWCLGVRFSIWVFVLANLFGAAGAIILTSFGSANIQPADLLLVFLAGAAIVTRGMPREAGRALVFPRAGFWLALTAGYVVFSAMFLPRIFAGATDVYAISRGEVTSRILAIPLGPTSGNVTQTLYFLGDVICFLIFYAAASRPPLFRTIVKAALACAAANLAFALLDLATFWTHTEALLGFIRNASYRMLDEATALGFKRIVGSFAEASSFAYTTLGLFAFCLRLWLAGIHARVTGPLALLSLAAIAFATSSTGYAGAAVIVIALFALSLARTLTGRVTRPTMTFVAIGPLALITLVVGIRLDQPAWSTVQTLVDETVVNKLSSASGAERARWNDQALVNFEQTAGMGAGIGAVRASSFPIAVLGNIGVIGALAYGGFLLAVLVPRRARMAANPYPAACQSAARWACLAQLAGACASATLIDLSLPFFVFAGLACAAIRDPVEEGSEMPAVRAPEVVVP